MNDPVLVAVSADTDVLLNVLNEFYNLSETHDEGKNAVLFFLLGEVLINALQAAKKNPI